MLAREIATMESIHHPNIIRWLFILAIKCCLIFACNKSWKKTIPLQAWTGPQGSGGWGSQNFETVGKWRWQGCQPNTPADLTPQEILLVFISVRGWVHPRAAVWPKAWSQWKIPITPSGIEPVAFGLVVQCLNRLHYCIPLFACNGEDWFM
jgi:hypothetical protein